MEQFWLTVSHTGWWLAITWTITLIVTGTVSVIIVTTTHRGKLWWQLNKPLLQKNKAVIVWLITVVGLIGIRLIQIRLQVLDTYAMSALFTGLQYADSHAFWHSVTVVMTLGAMSIVLETVQLYTQGVCALRWQRALTYYLLGRWIQRDTFYLMQLLPQKIDNPDQRIETDTQEFAPTTLELFLQCIYAGVSAEESIRILWNLSFPLHIWFITIPRSLLTCTICYVVTNTIIAYFISRPLISLNFFQQQYAANFRAAMSKIKNNAIQIALFNGGRAELNATKHAFHPVLTTSWKIIIVRSVLSGFNSSTGMFTIFGLCIQVPTYFAHKVTLGNMMQGSMMMSSLHTSLTFIQHSLSQITSYFATLDRLTQLQQELNRTQHMPLPTPLTTKNTVAFDHMTIYKPDHSVLISELTYTLTPGSRLLITGPSGIGKSTLLLALAGLWPYVEGICQMPPRECIAFVPQKNYFPTSELSSALAYPHSVVPTKSKTHHLLQQVGLDLDDLGNNPHHWETELSLGQLQKINFARVIFHAPTVIILDEASASLDEDSEQHVYTLLETSLPESIIISVGHRPSLRRYHDHELVIHSNGSWDIHSL